MRRSCRAKGGGCPCVESREGIVTPCGPRLRATTATPLRGLAFAYAAPAGLSLSGMVTRQRIASPSTSYRLPRIFSFLDHVIWPIICIQMTFFAFSSRPFVGALLTILARETRQSSRRFSAGNTSSRWSIDTGLSKKGRGRVLSNQGNSWMENSTNAALCTGCQVAAFLVATNARVYLSCAAVKGRREGQCSLEEIVERSLLFRLKQRKKKEKRRKSNCKSKIKRSELCEENLKGAVSLIFEPRCKGSLSQRQEKNRATFVGEGERLFTGQRFPFNGYT